jgi:hypothetical protein
MIAFVAAMAAGVVAHDACQRWRTAIIRAQERVEADG